MRRLPPLLALLAAMLLLLSVAFADGRPTVFYDSHSYDVMGRNLIETVRDYPASAKNKYEQHIKMGDWPVPSDRLVDPQVEQARSPFYGVLLHATYLAGSIWILAVLQSFLAGWVIYLLWRTLTPPGASRWSYLAVVGAAAAGTSVSFYTTFAMPDVFAGIGGAALVLILSQADRLKKLEIAGLWVLIAYAMMVHKSHWGTGLMMAACGGLLVWAMGVPLVSVAKRVMVILTAAMVAWFAGTVFDTIYQSRTGYKLGHPPFVMARMLADGSARDYMRHACASGENYAMCRFQANVKGPTTPDKVLGNIDNILWSNRPQLGMFNLASRAERIRLETEEMRFVLGAVKHDPLGQFSNAMWDWGQQFVAYQVLDPLRNPSAFLRGKYWPTTIIPKLIPNFEACRPPGDCRPPFNYMFLADWHGLVLGVSLLLLVVRLGMRDVRDAVFQRGLKTGDDRARVAAAVLLIFGLAAINAGICGILSGPFERYQSRLIWLVPVGAGLVCCALPMRYEAWWPAIKGAWGRVVGFWDVLRAQPGFGRFLPPLNGHFVRFCCVGGLGFVADFTILTSVVGLGVNKIAARLLSFSVAVVVTWLVNRLWTFRAHEGPKQSLLREFGRYLTVQSVGFAANFAIYTLVVYALPTKVVFLQLLVGSLAGTAAGMMINYLGAKHIVFRRHVVAPDNTTGAPAALE